MAFSFILSPSLALFLHSLPPHAKRHNEKRESSRRFRAKDYHEPRNGLDSGVLPRPARRRRQARAGRGGVGSELEREQ